MVMVGLQRWLFLLADLFAGIIQNFVIFTSILFYSEMRTIAHIFVPFSEKLNFKTLWRTKRKFGPALKSVHKSEQNKIEIGHLVNSGN